MKTIVVEIKPLSVNDAWQGKRFKTKEYKRYESAMSLLLYKDRVPEPITGKLEVWYRFYLKNCSMSDVDNPIKPLNDILVRNKIIKDDRYIYKAHQEKIPCSDGDRVEIDIAVIE